MAEKSNKKTILCVDDEADLRDNISIILKDEGYNIIEAEDGKEAYEKFAIYKPDLILCDINMPVMNGYELLKKIHDEHQAEFNSIPFIFLTALGQKHNYLRGVKLGADEYIVKPIDFEILLSTIKTKIDKADTRQDMANEKLTKLCTQISSLIPNEIQEPLQNIITLSVTLKKEISDKDLDPRYVDYIGKIYLSSLKLNAQIVRAFDKGKIENMVHNLDSYVAVEVLLAQVKNKIDNEEIVFEVQNNLPDLAVKAPVFVNVLTKYLEQHIESDTVDLKLDAFQDYNDNLVISVSGNTVLPVFSQELEEVIHEFNGEFHVQDNEGVTYHIIKFPSFLLKKRDIALVQ